MSSKGNATHHNICKVRELKMELSQVNKDTYEVFRERLKILRKEKGYTQEKMAQLLNMGQSSYAKWENGRTEPTLKSIIELSKILDISTDYLLGVRDSREILK